MRFLDLVRKYLLMIIMTVIGIVGGYLYYRLVGCANGTCAITSNPWASSLYGGIFGALIGSMVKPCKQCKEEDHE